MMKEYTYIMIKPNGIKQVLTKEVLDEHYAHVADRSFVQK